MPSAEYDLRYLEAGLEVLEAYLLSDDLLWAPGTRSPAGDPPYQQLSLGGMLMAQARLAGRPLTEAEQARFDEAERQLADLKAHWQVAWERKAAAEFENRMRLWRNFVDDYRTHPHLHFDRYSYEVGRRVQLHLLAQEAGQISAHDQKMLALTDQIVRARLTPTPFIWETEAAPGFDPSVYWFLYGRLPKEPAAQA